MSVFKFLPANIRSRIGSGKLLVLLMTSAACIITGCSSSADSKTQDIQFSLGDISARGAIGRLEDTGPVFEGDGNEGVSLAILAPQIQGANVPEYLPLYIQGLLNSNFKKYSAMTIIDRQNLDQILKEQELGASGSFSDTDFIRIGSMTNAQYCVVGSIQRLSGSRFSLSLSVSDVALGEIKASSSQTGTLAQLEANGAMVNAASSDLLEQLGVKLTADGKQLLLAGNDATVKAEAGLAKGIIAQQGNETVTALFNFTQSIIFDPSQRETLNRLGELSLAISGGSTSQRILNDIQARDQWIDVFKETAAFYERHTPFEITFDPNLIQDGETDFSNRTADLQMRVALNSSVAAFDALNTLLEGLEKTGRRRQWGFNGWPFMDIEPQKIPEVVVFSGKNTFSYKVDVALLNDKKKNLGQSSITLNSGELNFTAADKKVTPPAGDRGIVQFRSIKADDLTPTLTIVVLAVNGRPSKDLNASGYMKIAPGDLSSENMVLIPGGSFIRTVSSYRNEVRTEISISPFYMGIYELSQKEYEKATDSNPSRFRDPKLPVEQLSWYDAVRYCNSLSQQEGLTPAYTITGSTGQNVTWNRQANGYRLPTEAEWEYACRAGTTTRYNTGDTITSNQANFDGRDYYSSRGEYRGKTTPVGSFEPNAWGLYDMHGNVAEWCWDWYNDYPTEAQTDPHGPASGTSRIVRGGDWNDSEGEYASNRRSYANPTNTSQGIGFRLARNF